jgi:hypothetical protein
MGTKARFPNGNAANHSPPCIREVISKELHLHSPTCVHGMQMDNFTLTLPQWHCIRQSPTRSFFDPTNCTDFIHSVFVTWPQKDALNFTAFHCDLCCKGLVFKNTAFFSVESLLLTIPSIQLCFSIPPMVLLSKYNSPHCIAGWTANPH